MAIDIFNWTFSWVRDDEDEIYVDFKNVLSKINSARTLIAAAAIWIVLGLGSWVSKNDWIDYPWKENYDRSSLDKIWVFLTKLDYWLLFIDTDTNSYYSQELSNSYVSFTGEGEKKILIDFEIRLNKIRNEALGLYKEYLKTWIRWDWSSTIDSIEWLITEFHGIKRTLSSQSVIELWRNINYALVSLKMNYSRIKWIKKWI